MYSKGAKVDLAMAGIAERQHGVVSARQLISIGMDRHRVSYRVRMGRLRMIHRGVYAVGHAALSHEARCMAAVLACGRHAGPMDGLRCSAVGSAVAPGEGERTRAILDHWGAALSHCSAAELWTLRPAGDGPADVLVPGAGGKKRRKGIRLRRSLTLLPADVTLRSGIPVTTPKRTIADLCRVASKPGRAGLISPRELRRAIRQAEVLGLPLGDDAKGDRTRSDLERDFLRLCRRHRLPAPQVNVRVGPHLVDFLWPDSAVIVETDGYRYHGGRMAFTEDRVRDLTLRSMGFEVIRVSEEQVNGEAGRVVDILRRVLESRSR